MKRRIYSIVLIEDENGKMSLTRKNRGFNAFELIGFIEDIKQELLKMLHGKMKVDVVKRIVETDKDSEEINK